MAEDSKSGPKVQILGIGVAMFSALCTVLAALITAGFFIGRAMRPAYHHVKVSFNP